MTARARAAGRSALLPALFSALALALLPAAARAQWIVEATAGRAVYDPVSAKIGAVNASLGARYQGTGRWLYLSGGTDLGSQGLLWGVGGLGVHPTVFRRGSWALGVDLGAHVYGFTESEYVVEEAGTPVTVTDPGDWGATLEAVPTATFRRGRVGVELRSGMVQTLGPYEDELLTGPVDGEFLVVTAYDGGASVSVEAAPGMEVEALGRYMRFPEGGYPYLGGSARLFRGRGALWAFGGRWFSDFVPSPRTGYGIGGSVRAPLGIEVSALWQQETSDPLYLNAPRQTWSVRVSRRLGRAAELPGAVGVTPADGAVAIRLPLSAAEEAPFVLGDFTEWQPVPMVRNGEFWEVRLDIPSGVYHYGFRTAAGDWLLPESLPRADDGMGGESAVLVVP